MDAASNPSPAAQALAKAPAVRIGNGLLEAHVLLPDPGRGFYQGVRFDRGGMIASLTCQGHEFYGLWFDRIASDILDYEFEPAGIAAGPNTAALGPADGYDPFAPIGYAAAAPGEAFLKIGVGLLRKAAGEAAYSGFNPYELIDAGEWTTEAEPDGVVFTHALSNAATGYGYVYRKTLRLRPGAPVLEIGYSLLNTGVRPLRTSAFNHNFATFGGAPAQAGLELLAAFPLQPAEDLGEAVQVDGGRLVFRRPLAAREVAFSPFAVPPGAPYDLALRTAAGLGVRVRADRPLSALMFWAIQATACVEPFVEVEAAPGETASWTFEYAYEVPVRD